MSPRPFSHEAETQEIPNYLVQLQELAAEEGVPEGAISERGYALAAEFLETMWRDHGDPGSENYKHYHNDGHALNVIRRSWRLWKPLREQLPERFDESGFEILMIAGAGHDVINDPEAAKNNPGQNEQQSADLVYKRMIEVGYTEDEAQRGHDSIVKTTVERNEDGVIVQTYMREGSTDITGLVLGQADMNGILLEGPATLFDDAYAIWLEMNKTPIKDAFHNPAGVVNFMLDEEKYLADRVAALSDDLKYYVADPEEREVIIQVYRDEFSSASLRALKTAHAIHSTPETTRKMVDESFSFAGRIAQRGLSQITAAKHHLVDRFKSDDEE